jgi:predicted helicase
VRDFEALLRTSKETEAHERTLADRLFRLGSEVREGKRSWAKSDVNAIIRWKKLQPLRRRIEQASTDGLGLNEPRIIAEVKHRQGQMGTEKVRSFITVLRSGFKGLYVSTGGFTKEARYEAERAEVPLTLIDLDGLVDLVIQYYDNFDAETKVLIPLTKIYWPK